ncbi:MAG: hypothetical protein AMJ46_07645 [Latescibacteria bacterium DG_63]|nr:MAG: hypothetical protein AMJ46_07645 [Latescibacteria bacterium DG_63]
MNCGWRSDGRMILISAIVMVSSAALLIGMGASARPGGGLAAAPGADAVAPRADAAAPGADAAAPGADAVTPHGGAVTRHAGPAAPNVWADIDGDGAAEPECHAGDDDRDGVLDDWLHSGLRLAEREHDLLSGGTAVSVRYLDFAPIWDSGNHLNNVWHMAVDDFDSDGSMGILSMAFTPTKQLHRFENDADNSFALNWVSPASLSPPGAFVTVAGGDSDLDGQGEMIGGETSTLNQVLLYESVDDDTFEYRDVDISEPDFTGQLSMDRVLVADTDGDTRREIVFDIGGASGGKVFIYEQIGPIGQNTYTKVYEYETVSYLVDCAIGDSDNDGNQEIILGVGGWPIYPMHLRRLEYNPDLNTYEHKMMDPGVTGLPLAPAVGDIDDDGLNELVMGSAVSAGGILYILEAIADDEYVAVYESPTCFNGNVLTTALGPVLGSPYPGIIAGSHGGELRLYGFDGETYQSLLEQSIASGGPIRGSHLGLADGDDLPEIAFSSQGDDRVYVYEQIRPPVVELGLVPLATVVPRGGDLEFDAVLENTTPETQMVWGRTDVYLPGGSPYGGNPLLGPIPITLGPYGSVTRHLSHAVPLNAPLGVYSYAGTVGVPPDTIIDQDEFDFEVIEGFRPLCGGNAVGSNLEPEAEQVDR